jgi:hypothetical protein
MYRKVPQYHRAVFTRDVLSTINTRRDHRTALGRKNKRALSSKGMVLLDSCAVKHASPRPGIREFRALHGPEVLCFPVASRAQAKPDRMGVGLVIRPLGVDRRPAPVLGAVRGRASRDGRGSWRLRGMLDGGEELQGAAALGTVFHIDLGHALQRLPWLSRFGPALAIQNRSRRFCEQPGPAHTGRRRVRERRIVVR